MTKKELEQQVEELTHIIYNIIDHGVPEAFYPNSYEYRLRKEFEEERSRLKAYIIELEDMLEKGY